MSTGPGSSAERGLGGPPVDKGTRQAIRLVAGARAHGWRLVAELVAEPSTELVERLRSGQLAEELRDATQWLGPDADRFLTAYASLEAFARRSRRTTAEADHGRLGEEYARLFPDGTQPVVEAASDMAARCDAEADAWARDDAAARDLRQAQHQHLERTVLDWLPAWCADVDERAGVALYRTVARVVASYLSVESGRDFDRSLFGWTRDGTSGT